MRVERLSISRDGFPNETDLQQAEPAALARWKDG
jgi:hypothetical protein